MKIVSNFKDYYDSIIGYGVDKTIQYKRFKNVVKFIKQSTIKFKHSPIKYSYDDNRIKIDSFIVMFCNELHIGYKVSRPKKGRTFTYEIDEDIVYGIDEVKKFFINEKQPKISPYKIRRWRRWQDYSDWREAIKRYEDKIKNTQLKDDWHVHFQSPVIIIDYDGEKSEGIKVICNPQLKNWNFQKVKDPFTIFQQISMYISNIFGLPGNEIVEVSEKTKIEKHGFDKWSFRKMPKEKK